MAELGGLCKRRRGGCLPCSWSSGYQDIGFPPAVARSHAFSGEIPFSTLQRKEAESDYQRLTETQSFFLLSFGSSFKGF